MDGGGGGRNEDEGEKEKERRKRRCLGGEHLRWSRKGVEEEVKEKVRWWRARG